MARFSAWRVVAIFAVVSLAASVRAWADQEPPTTRPTTRPISDFPPGVFTDGKVYSLKNCTGDLIVLFFVLPTDSRLPATIPQREAVFDTFRDKRVQVFTIASNAPLPRAVAFAQQSRISTPVFCDGLGVMAARYKLQIDGDRPWKGILIHPNGQYENWDFTAAAIKDKIPPGPPSYSGLDEQLAGAAERLRLGQYEEAVRLLNQLKRNRKIADAASGLLQDIYKQADAWKEQADALAETSPVEAYDLYARCSAALKGTDRSTAIDQALLKLRNVPPVKEELLARRAYAELCIGASGSTAAQKARVIDFGNGILRQFKGTPTAQIVLDFLQELGPPPPQQH